MLKIANFILFHFFWFAAVAGAGAGNLWLGPLVAALVVVAHLKMIPRGRERLRELQFILLIGLAGTLADSLMMAIGVTVYPTSAASWPYAIVPPWITSLWLAFATMPRFSLAWLEGRPALATTFGAIGGPMSYFFGTRFGAVAVGDSALWTFAVLAVEYAIFMPLMMAWRPRAGDPVVAEKTLAPCTRAELSPVRVRSDASSR